MVCSFTHKYFHDPHDFNVYSLILTYHIFERGLRTCNVLYGLYCLTPKLTKNAVLFMNERRR